MRPVVIVVGIVVGAVLISVAVLWLFQRSLIYFPSPDVPDLSVVVPSAQHVVLVSEDGLALAALLIPAGGDANGVTVVVFSGNAGNRADRIPLAIALTAEGYNVLLFDYRGYGGNSGHPSEEGIIADGSAAVAYLDSRSDIDQDRVVFVGESLGAAVAIAVAEKRPPLVLVLRSPFTSLPDVARAHYPFLPSSTLLWDRFPNEEMIRGIDVPVLVVAGSQDATVPIDQSVRVYEAAGGPKELVILEGADHNDQTLTSGSQLVESIVRVIAEQSQP